MALDQPKIDSCQDTGPCLIRLDQGVLVPSYISPLYPLFWLSRLSNTQLYFA
jgi:hypothetical protein